MAVTATSSTAAATTATTNKTATTFDKNAFLNLLVTQLKYQDPLDPMKSTDFMSQLAQISQVEQMQNMSSSLDSIQTTLANNNVGQWISSIGKKMNVDSNILSKGDQVYLTPAGDFDKVVLTLKSTVDGSTQQVTINKGESLLYTYDGDNAVTMTATALKNNQTVGCTTGAYRIIKAVEADNGTPVLIAGSGESYSVDKVKQIKE